MELPSDNDRTDTEYNSGSIPDEVDPLNDGEMDEAAYRTLSITNQHRDSDLASLKRSNTIELSKKCDSIDINSIFYSESLSNESLSKHIDDEKGYVELCRELNDMAVDLIKQGIRLQEGEDEECEGEEEDEDEKLQRAAECFNKAKAYLSAWLNHAYNNHNLFNENFIASIHYNLSWVYQKIPDLAKWAHHLDEVIKLVTPQHENNSVVELNKIKYLTKFQLQQWAIKSQLDDHMNALNHGKASVKNCHSLIFKTYKLCRKKIDKEIKKKHQKRLRVSYKNDNLNIDTTSNEYGIKNIPNKRKNQKVDKSKYFQTNNQPTKVRKRRRWLSEENSSNSSVNLSTQRVVLNKRKSDSRDSSLENVHTFHLKQSPTESNLRKSISNLSLHSERVALTARRQDTALSESDNGSAWIYVEERVKLLKNNQFTSIYKSLKELCKQTKEFKSYYLLSMQKQDDFFEDKTNMRRKLWVSFSEEDDIQEIIRDESFKINTRSVLGVKNNNDWIYGLNIGNIMHLTPFNFDEFNNSLNEVEQEEKILKELTSNSVLEKIILLASAYFWIATELRFMHKKLDEKAFPK